MNRRRTMSSRQLVDDVMRESLARPAAEPIRIDKGANGDWVKLRALIEGYHLTDYEAEAARRMVDERGITFQQAAELVFAGRFLR